MALASAGAGGLARAESGKRFRAVAPAAPRRRKYRRVNRRCSPRKCSGFFMVWLSKHTARSLIAAIQSQRPHPAGVVFFDPPVAVNDRALLPAIKLIVHPMPRNRLDQPALFAMEIRVFIPTGRIEEKVSRAPCRFRRQTILSEL